MSKYSQRVEALENNEKKKKRIFAVIIVILVVIFLGGMVLGAQSILDNEGILDPNAITATEPLNMDISPNDATAALGSALKASTDPNKVKISVYTDVEIPDESISVESGDESILTQLKYIKPKILESIKGYYQIYEGKFGENFSAKVIPAAFGASDISSAECKRGKTNDDGSLGDYDTLFYTLKFPQAPFENVEKTVLFKNFGMGISEKIKNTFVADIGEIAAAENIKISCSDFSITFDTKEENEQIKNIWYNRGYSVTLSLTFKGDLAALGTQVISFDFYAKESHWYTYAGLELSEHKLSIEKGDVQALEAYRTADGDYEASWVSSDPDIVSVDDKGYIKGKANSDKPVTITASFNYLGHTYKDSCTVFVRKPVEKIKVTTKELALKIGETKTLSVKITPKSATIHEVMWFTEDESIAKVDKNGVVAAVGKGTTKVYAIAADGYFRSSCTVTVKD